MTYDEEVSHAAALAEVALVEMKKHGVPPTPRNYAVWYAHVSGRHPELSRMIEILVSNNQPFTAERNDELYSRMTDGALSSDLVARTSDQLQTMMAELLRHLEAASGGAKSYSETLGAYSTALARGSSLEQLRNVVTGLIAETKSVIERNQRLESQLTQSSGEIAALRQNLEVVQREAVTDALTGILNRKAFEARLRAAMRDAMEGGEDLSLLFIDIDHFKSFNDNYGHQLGDQVLRLVAKTLKDCVKGRDATARYGGEEFAIILPQTRLNDAVGLAEQIRGTMMRRKIVRKGTRDDFGHITLSIGASRYRPGEPAADFVARADKALYLAKRSGRNRVQSEKDLATPDAAAE